MRVTCSELSAHGSAKRGLETVLRNWAFNLIGSAWSLLIGLVTVPSLVRGLGVENFGVLCFVWMLASYFGFLELGIGRATLRHLASCLSEAGRGEAQRILSTSLTASLGLGVLAGVALGSSSTVLARMLLSGDQAHHPDATSALCIIAFSLPLVFCQGVLASIPVALERFDVINFLDICAATVRQLGAVALVWWGHGIKEIALWTAAVTALASLGYAFVAHRLAPYLSLWPGWDRPTFLALFRFGWWLTVSQLAGPLLVYLDRFMVTYFSSVAALGYYSVPCELALRIAVVPSALASALFPAIGYLAGAGDTEAVGRYCVRSVRYVLLATFPAAILLYSFARQILSFWIDASFSDRATAVLQVFAVGVLVNCLARVPLTVLQAKGRPDLPAKYHLAELPLYAVLCWLVIPEYGIEGAAAAWTARVTLDTALLFWGVRREIGLWPVKGAFELKGSKLGVWVGLCLLCVLLGRLFVTAWAVGVSAVGWLIAYGIFVRRHVLEAEDRATMLATADLRKG
jgi:O-antigen/teichoic acid export membrane protein